MKTIIVVLTIVGICSATFSGCPCHQTSFGFVSCTDPFLRKFPNDFTDQCALYPTDRIYGLAIDFQDVDQLNPVEGFQSLSTLSISNNRLTHIRKGIFEDNQDLRFLALAQNNLRSIEPGTLDPLINAKTIHLSDNPNLKDITTQ